MNLKISKAEFNHLSDTVLLAESLLEAISTYQPFSVESDQLYKDIEATANELSRISRTLSTLEKTRKLEEEKI